MSNIRAFARWAAVALLGLVVVGVTVDGFAQSYAGLLRWGLEHRLTGWQATAFPPLVDAFVVAGELGLFLLAIDGHTLDRKRLLTWTDLALPGTVAVGGWTASLVFNVGRIQHGTAADQVTAAVSPVAAMVGLLILLRTLHRYVTAAPQEPVAEACEETPVDHPGWESATRPYIWPAFRLQAVPDAELEAAEGSGANHPQPPPVDADHAGQLPPLSIGAAVRAAKVAGRSEREIGEAFDISRHQVRKHLRATPEPGESTRPTTGRPLAAVNGHRPTGA